MNKTLARACALTLLASAAVASVWASGADASTGGPAPDAADTAVTDDPRNPLLSEWTGPYGGVPPFDRVKVADFKPALEAAMNENLSEVERIADDPAAPTFENTVVALERAGHALDRVTTVYAIWSSNMKDR